MEQWNYKPMMNVHSKPTYSMDYVWKNNKLYKVQLFIKEYDEASLNELIHVMTTKNNLVLDKVFGALITLKNTVNLDSVQILKLKQNDGIVINSVHFIEVDLIDK